MPSLCSGGQTAHTLCSYRDRSAGSLKSIQSSWPAAKDGTMPGSACQKRGFVSSALGPKGETWFFMHGGEEAEVGADSPDRMMLSSSCLADGLLVWRPLSRAGLGGFRQPGALAALRTQSSSAWSF